MEMLDFETDWFEGLTEEQVMLMLFYWDFHDEQEVV
jgi:hypothetical protein